MHFGYWTTSDAQLALLFLRFRLVPTSAAMIPTFQPIQSLLLFSSGSLYSCAILLLLAVFLMDLDSQLISEGKGGKYADEEHTLEAELERGARR